MARLASVMGKPTSAVTKSLSRYGSFLFGWFNLLFRQLNLLLWYLELALQLQRSIRVQISLQENFEYTLYPGLRMCAFLFANEKSERYLLGKAKKSPMSVHLFSHTQEKLSAGFRY